MLTLQLEEPFSPDAIVLIPNRYSDLFEFQTSYLSCIFKFSDLDLELLGKKKKKKKEVNLEVLENESDEEKVKSKKPFNDCIIFVDLKSTLALVSNESHQKSV